nr:UbiD family decarboxylase [Rhizobium sp. Q54]
MDMHPTPRRYASLRHFAEELERRGRLKRIARPVSLVHEVTEIHRRVLLAGGPALLFEKPVDACGRVSDVPLLTNLFGTQERIEWGFGLESGGIGHLAETLAALRHPEPPKSFRDVMAKVPLLTAALSMRTKQVAEIPAQEVVWRGEDIDLSRLPIQWCWPGEPAPLVTWPLVITRSPDDRSDVNVGVYRMQVLGKDRLIMRWLAHRGGARHHRMWQRRGEDMPVAVVIGADPAMLLAAVMPLPEGMSEIAFSGVLRGQRTRSASALTVPISVPASAEIVLEGRVSATDTAEEGPYGDHTGYYNSVEPFPVMTLSAITSRRDPLYLSTFTGRPPDEPSVLGEAMMELFLPLAKRQFPEIVDLWMPPEACSYRAMVVSIDKRYPGQARRIMMGLWSMLPQFSYTKLIIAVDPDINVRSWSDVIWALSTRFDASRDLLVIRDTPIDYLDFASPQPGLGGKLGLDATTKLPPETDREWGRVLSMPPEIVSKMDALWADLGLEQRP